MIHSYLTITLRRLWRTKTAAFVHITGLSLGISCGVIIAVLLQFELGFDAHHPKGERLYRVVTDEIRQDRTIRSGGSPGAMADALMNEVTGVEQATIVYVEYAGLFTVERNGRIEKFEVEPGVARATPEFFSMFDIAVLRGSVEDLREPLTMVLARSIAEKFFGPDNPIGQVVKVNNDKTYRVVGVVADPPKQSHVNFTVVMSGADMKAEDPWMYVWQNLVTNVQTYALLHSGVSSEEVERQTEKFRDLYMQNDVDKKSFHLQRITDIHFEPEYGGGPGRPVSRKTLSALGLIGVFLIVTACVNFVNMATAQATNRAREVGVRKVLGADPGNISADFLVETFLTVLISVVVSVLAVEMVLPFLTQRLGIDASLDLLDASVIGFLVLLLLGMTFLSGLYPAFVLRSFKPVSALKQSVSSGGKNLRKSLVVLQFTISQLLLASLIVVTTQMEYLKDRDLGLDAAGVMTVSLPNRDPARLATLKNELLSHAGVSSVSFSWSSAISGNTWDSNVRYDDGREVKIIPTDLKFGDEKYLDTYGLRLVAGRTHRRSDTINEYVVNESFARAMGFRNPEEALGRSIKLGSSRPYYPIVGIVHDFNIAPLHDEIRPTLLAAQKTSYHEAAIKLRTAGVAESLELIESVWDRIFPEYVYSMEFLDERIESFYEQEQRVELLFRVFTGIALLLGCIGLVGLVSFVTERKTKEIGVRKVLGASTAGILGILSKEFVLLLAIAFLIAAPVAYAAMSSWLESFAYRIQLGPGAFFLTIAVTIAIAGLTVGFRALRAARANPVENLRYE